MNLDTFIYCPPATFDAVKALENPPKLATQAITGFWKSFAGAEVYNVVGTSEEITELTDALEAATPGSVARVFSWVWRDGVDNIGVNDTIPDDILAVMKDHKTYDIDGNETSSTPPTFDTPNWGHTFFGQGERIFAGDFSDDFSGEYK